MTFTETLRSQLDEALVEGSVLEIAMLAGLLARHADVDPRVQLACRGLEVSELQEAVAQAVDAFAEVNEDDEPEESWDVLCALDELCAAATGLGHSDMVREPVQLAVSLARAFPEPWTAHADAARTVLATCAPLPGDPMLEVWQVIARAPAAIEEIRAEQDQDRAQVPEALLRRLGL